MDEENQPPPVPLYKNPGGDNWRYWYVLWYLTAKGSLQRRTWRPYPEARAFACSLGLRSHMEWLAWCRTGVRPYDIPAAPAKVYERSGWRGWGHWLGTGNFRFGSFRSFEAARAAARQLGLRNVDEWWSWSKAAQRPSDIPADPQRVYKNQGWAGWGDWLGTGNTLWGTFRPFMEARTLVHSLGLPNEHAWRAWCKSEARPSDIPAKPERVYAATGWAGWGDWLGTGRPVRHRRILSDRQARYLAELDDECGPLSEGEIDAARRLWHDEP